MPPISIMGFGRMLVSSEIRVPRPPARITAFKVSQQSLYYHSTGKQRVRRNDCSSGIQVIEQKMRPGSNEEAAEKPAALSTIALECPPFICHGAVRGGVECSNCLSYLQRRKSMEGPIGPEHVCSQCQPLAAPWAPSTVANSQAKIEPSDITRQWAPITPQGYHEWQGVHL